MTDLTEFITYRKKRTVNTESHKHFIGMKEKAGEIKVYNRNDEFISHGMKEGRE